MGTSPRFQALRLLLPPILWRSRLTRGRAAVNSCWNEGTESTETRRKPVAVEA